MCFSVFLACRTEVVSCSRKVSFLTSLYSGTDIRVEKSYLGGIAYIILVNKAIELMVGATERGEYLILVRAIWSIVTTEVVYTHSSR